MGMDALRGGGATPPGGLSGPGGVAGGGDPASVLERLKPLLQARMQQQGQPVAQQMPAQVPDPAGGQDPSAMTKPQVPAGAGGGAGWDSMSAEPNMAPKPVWQQLAERGIAGQGSAAENKAKLAEQLQAVADNASGSLPAGAAPPMGGGIQALRQKVLDAAGAGAIARDARPGNTIMTKPAVRGGAQRRRVAY